MGMELIHHDDRCVLLVLEILRVVSMYIVHLCLYFSGQVYLVPNYIIPLLNLPITSSIRENWLSIFGVACNWLLFCRQAIDYLLYAS